MPTAKQLFEASQQRAPRTDQWVWWTLAAFLAEHDKGSRGRSSIPDTESNEITRMLSLIDALELTSLFDDCLREDEEIYLAHKKRVEAKAQKAVLHLQQRMEQIDKLYGSKLTSTHSLT